MKLTVNKPTVIEPKYIRCAVAVRYDEEDIPNDFPFRTGDIWDVTVDIDTGKILDWPEGRAENVYMKVCDRGSYYLLDADKNELAKIDEDYVPSCIPGDYGDCINFQIDGTGKVADWHKDCDANEIKESFFRD